MNNVENTSKSEASLTNTPDGRQAWQKPEAKVADVASVTLAGSHARQNSDLATCAS
ncbi:MAG TPA: hypothetical protein VGN16_04895 [Acidobacteriaceae bacterium]|jgi:hypothetical protein